MSSDPNSWTKPPPPPMLKDIRGAGGQDERLQQLAIARGDWVQQTYSQYGKLNLPYFDFTGYDSGTATNSQEGLDRIASRAGKFYLKLSTPNTEQSIQARGPDGSNIANARFVDAIKSVLAKCH
jgi:hypothetical protein